MIEQGSLEWKQLRCGKVTASRVADVVARTKTGYGASRANYLAEIIAEQLTGVPVESYVNAAMQWGKDTEPQARAAFEFFRDTSVELIDFVDHPTIPKAGASPDGTIGEDGLIEIKCPLTSTHIDTLLGKTVPAKYVTQIQWQLACTGRKYCEFVSFDPRMVTHMQLFVQRVERDDQAIAFLEDEVKAFLAEIDTKIALLNNVYGPVERAA
jgi:putative phage-type endonuclease